MNERETRTTAGWANELGLLAQHQGPMPGWVRSAIRTIQDGLVRSLAAQAEQPRTKEDPLPDVVRCVECTAQCAPGRCQRHGISRHQHQFDALLRGVNNRAGDSGPDTEGFGL